MNETEIKKEIEKNPITAPKAVTVGAAPKAATVSVVQVGAGAPKRFERKPFDGRKNPRKSGNRGERAKPEYDQKILNIRRVTRVVAGGKRFNFSVAMILGNRKGMVGVGTGKGGDTALAIEKAMRNAKKNIVKIPVTKNMSIPHRVDAKYSSAIVVMMPVKGKGLIAGSAVRDVLELAGIKDTVAKILSGSKNKLNIARATIKALLMLKAPVETLKKAEAKAV
ncbi:MAG: 30S ribosomal protein S5 [Candidatus Paceibacterota bacterium]|jgi:small subunit ribosomal protein S5